MKLIFTLFFSAVGGFAAHQTRQLIDNSFESQALRNVASYGVGVLSVIPFAAAIHAELDDMECSKRPVLAWLLASVCFGLGVLGGYVADEVGR